MSRPRIVIAKLRQLIELESSGLITRERGRLRSLAQGTVFRYRSALRLAGLKWDEARQLGDSEIEWRVRKARAELR